MSSKHSPKDIPSGNTVSVGEFVRNFARYRQATDSGPVWLTNHSRRTHVLLSATEYASLHDRARQSGSGTNPLIQLGEWVSDALIVCDRNLKIKFINRVAEATMRGSREDIVGRTFDQLPAIEGTHVANLIRSANMASEPTTVEISSPFANDAWLRLRYFPWKDDNVVLFRDITRRVVAQRLLSAKDAIIEAMNLHGKIGYLRVTQRGTISRIEKPIVDMLGLPEDRLIGIPIIDLVSVSSRVAFRDAMEEAIANGKPQKVSAQLTTNFGEQRMFDVAMVQYSGVYGVEGAVMILTEQANSGA